MHLDPLFLSRLQFGLTVMFHYLFPPLTIGLGLVMVCIEAMYLWTRDPRYESMAKFWTKVFAVNFAVGVATGIVMEFEFGTNWAAYSRYVGDVFGSALAAEGIFAFFLESGFLAVLVFGWDRVGPKMHFFSTAMVFLGSVFSSVWITVANSWMQTPAGYHIVASGAGTRAEITDFWALVFNPSSVVRLVHVWIAAFILGGFFVLSISAWYVLKGRHVEFARKSFALGLLVALVGTLAAPISGHFHAHEVAEYQPTKLARFEGVYHSGSAELYLWGLPSDESQTVRMGIGIPGGLSWLIHVDANAPVRGMDEFAPEDLPPGYVFQTYHWMIILGLFMLALTLLASFLWWRGRLFEQRWLMWTFVFAVLAAYAANQLGWVSAEAGRQPWIVYGLMRTSNAVSSSVSGGEVLSSIIMFGVIYALLFAVWVFVLNNKIQHGPEPVFVPERTSSGELIAVAASRANPAGPSLSEADDVRS